MKYFIIIFSALFFGSCAQEKKDIKGDKTINQEPMEVSIKDTVSKYAPVPKNDTLKFSIEYLMGKFDPANHPDFVTVDKKHSNGRTFFLRKETYSSFTKMWEAAKADGIDLKIISATRNFEAQKSIWEAKWTGERKIENGSDAAEKYPNPKTRALKILEYSSMPGTSRHHWGTDIDINNLTNEYFESGQGKKEYDWLVLNAPSFGFCQPYSPKGSERPYGYNEEKWHWSYMPTSKPLTDFAEDELKDKMIGGFKGAEVAEDIGVVEKYVLGINSTCRH